MSSVWDETKARFRRLLPGGPRPPRVSTASLALFTRQISAMVDAGISLPRALSFYAETEASDDLPEVVQKISDRVIAGTSVSHAMRGHPEVFSDVYISLLETGESSGQIGTVLQRLALLLEKNVRMQKRVVAAATYPAILLAVSLLCLSVFVLFILPLLEPVFLGLKMELPAPTRVLLASRYVLGPFVGVLFVGSILVWGAQPAFQAYLKLHEPLRERLAYWPTRIPLVGPVYLKILISRVLFSMATMLESGMTLVSALNRSAAAAGNFWIWKRLQLSKNAIVEGETLAEAFSIAEVFPETAIALVTVAEETSTLSMVIAYVAEMYEEDTDMALVNMTNLLEPVLMAGMGVVVGFIVISAMLPMLQLVNNL